jgi:hypothetical protein
VVSTRTSIPAAADWRTNTKPKSCALRPVSLLGEEIRPSAMRLVTSVRDSPKPVAMSVVRLIGTRCAKWTPTSRMSAFGSSTGLVSSVQASVQSSTTSLRCASRGSASSFAASAGSLSWKRSSTVGVTERTVTRSSTVSLTVWPHRTHSANSQTSSSFWLALTRKRPRVRYRVDGQVRQRRRIVGKSVWRTSHRMVARTRKVSSCTRKDQSAARPAFGRR